MPHLATEREYYNSVDSFSFLVFVRLSILAISIRYSSADITLLAQSICNAFITSCESIFLELINKKLFLQ